MSASAAMARPKRTALDGLTPKRKAFVVAYCGEACGNATEAARLAGYGKPHPEGSRLLRIATVAAAVEALRGPGDEKAIATLEELRAFWTEAMRGEAPDWKDRLKASELLGKSRGAFLDRVEHSGVPQVQLAIVIQTTDERVRLTQLARAELTKGEDDAVDEEGE